MAAGLVNERARAWLVAAAVSALVVGAVLYLRTGSAPSPPREPRPLASPALAPGTVGGLLPDIVLDGRYGNGRARALRPAVILLAAPGCECVEIARQVVADATPVGVVTYVVMAGAGTGPAERIAVQAGGSAAAYADPDGVLARTYGLRTDAALVLVRSDGVVTQVVAGVAPSLQLGRALRALVV